MNLIASLLAVWSCVVAAKEEKLAKHFSLFSVVTFGNEECTSDTSISGGATQGTCYSSTECSDKNGMASGNCASGFGVCCVFLNTGAATATISENRTRLRNAEFPSIATATTAQTIVYTINKMNADICQIRLDFGTMVIAGPINTQENIAAGDGTGCQDKLQLTTTDATAWTNSPTGTLCGALTGEHVYVELSPTSSDALTATLTTLVSGTLTPAIAQRVWDIKVSQIECHATFRAPPGCVRYYMEDYGKIASYNFYHVTGGPRAANSQNTGLELSLQNTRSCIRRAKHACCVEYQLCTSFNGIALADFSGTGTSAGLYNEAFSTDLDAAPFGANTHYNQGAVDSMCTNDYVDIPTSMSRSCGATFGSHYNAMNTRYCGTKFGANFQRTNILTTSTSVCDCSEPWTVTFHTDDLNDSGAGGAATTGLDADSFPRGVCLDYKQVPCMA